MAQWRALLADAVDRLAHRLERDLGPPRRGLSPVAALERGPYGLLAGATEATAPGADYTIASGALSASVAASALTRAGQRGARFAT